MQRAEALKIVRPEPIGRRYRIGVVRDPADLAALRKEWNALAEASRISHPFVLHEWFTAWWAAFGKGQELAVITVHHEESLVAVAPLMKNRCRMFGIGLRRIQSIYNAHSPAFEFLIHPDYAESSQALWDHLVDTREEWDLLELNQIPRGSSTLERIRDFATSAACPSGTWWAGDSPYVDLSGNWGDYLSGLRRKHRSNMRNRMNRLNRVGAVEIDEIDGTEPELESHLDAGFRIEAASWKGTRGTAVRCESDAQTFYSSLAEDTAGRMLRLFFLRVAGKAVAFAYTLEHNGKLFLLKIGYDPAFSRYSPFNVLCLKVLERCAEKRIVQFEFLGVHDAWKRNWAELARPHDWLYVFSGSVRSRLAHLAKFECTPMVRGLVGGDDRPSPFTTQRFAGGFDES